VARDVEWAGGLDAEVVWLHRRTRDAEIYFLSNQTDQPQALTARFRVTGQEAELWQADTGNVQPASYSYNGDKTIVPLQLAQREAVFVVFRKKNAEPKRTIPLSRSQVLATVAGPWEVDFPPHLGAPPKIQLASLQSWTDNGDEGVKYFSGHATYHKVITVSPQWFHSGERQWLDLGRVADLAQVTVNGKRFDVLWKAPYEVDVTDLLRPGENQLEVMVTNQWTNRLVGDRALPAAKKVLGDNGVSPSAFGAPMTTPPEAGLLGPVTIVGRTVQ
jgi:hypothetical protein